MLERETKECRVRTEEWYVMFEHFHTVGGTWSHVHVFFYVGIFFSSLLLKATAIEYFGIAVFCRKC